MTALAVLTGCGSTEPSQEASSAPAQDQLSDVLPPLMPAMPLPDNAVEDAVAKLDGIAKRLIDQTGIPGMSVAVVHGGKTVYSKGFGVKDSRNGSGDVNRIDPDTVFQLASLSKPVGSTVVAHEVGKGDIGWDTPIAEKLPWFALADPAVTRMVTVGDMYSHRSGLPDHAGDMLEDMGYDRRQILERLRQLPLDPFRVSYAYTNFGLTAAAEAVAVNAGTTWEDLSQDVMFRPLGMTSTSSRFDEYQARPNRAAGHIHVDGKYFPRYVRDPQPEAPAGGVSSSANDMAKWMAMVLANGSHDGKTIVEPAALLPALSPQIVSSPPTEAAMRSGFYGYGFNVGSTSAGRTQMSHSGAFELGANTNVLFLPSADVGIVVLTNATPAGVPETLTAEFADLVQYGEVRTDWFKLYNGAYVEMEKPVGSLVGQQPPANPAPSAPLSEYVGEYANPYFGAARITERNGELNLALGPKLNVPLKHWDGNVFAVSFVTENSPPGSTSTATFDGDVLKLDYYDEDGMGTFTK